MEDKPAYKPYIECLIPSDHCLSPCDIPARRKPVRAKSGVSEKSIESSLSTTHLHPYDPIYVSIYFIYYSAALIESIRPGQRVCTKCW
jgi:hypothetical protein